MRFREDLLRPDANNFTAVRLFLASSVIYTHSFVVLGGPDQDEITYILGSPISHMAVDGFFFLSGFLVYPSLTRLRDAGRFLLARLARLWPGLFASVMLTVLVGWLATTAPGTDYLGGATAHFIAGNLSFIKGYYALTGVACGAEPCNVNGSLWTLPMEARCYLALALLGITGLARPRLMVAVVLPLTLVGAFAWDFEAVRSWVSHRVGTGLAFQIDILHRLWPMFVLGALAYIARRHLPLSWWWLGGLLLLAVLTSHLGLAMQTRALFVGYAVLCLGLLTAARGSLSGKWPDYSYGMYIYASPMMLLAHIHLRSPSHWTLAVQTVVLTAPVAAASWHGVEKPAMSVFRRWQSRRPPTIPAAETRAPARSPRT